MLKCFSLKGSGGIKIFVQMYVLSRVHLLATPWTVAHQALLSMGFSTKILEWVAIFSSRGSSKPRDQTHIAYVSSNGGSFFTTNANQEVGGKKQEFFLIFFCKHFTSGRLSFCQSLPQKVLLPARFHLRNSFCRILSQILLLAVRFLPQKPLLYVRFHHRDL